MCPNLIINQDNYDLTQSQNQTLDKNNWDLEIDLCLNKFTGTPFIVGAGKALGTVKDKSNNPIKNATVILMSPKNQPIFQDNTDASGEYLINNIPQGNYFLIAQYTGKLTQKTQNFFIVPLSNIERNFVLQDDLGALAGIIVGSILGAAGVALVGVAVGLFFAGVLVAVTVTGEGGAFAFGGLAAGALFTVAVAAFGYLFYEFTQIARHPGEINNENPDEEEHELEIDYSVMCTISGIISDLNGNPVDMADVILYRVEIDNSLTAINFMKTNNEGLYLFMVPIGSYKVKSSQNTFLNIN